MFHGRQMKPAHKKHKHFASKTAINNVQFGITTMTDTPLPQAKPSHVKDLLLLFSIPAAIALLAAAFVYLPTRFAHPSYSFVYSYCGDYGCADSYSLSATNHVTKDAGPVDPYSGYTKPTTLAYYDAATGASRILTYDQARQYTLINSSKSPDGYTLVHATGSSGFFLWGDYKDTWQLENGAKKKVVQLNGTTDYSNEVKFIGRVQK
jgi:hypothetical protein